MSKNEMEGRTTVIDPGEHCVSSCAEDRLSTTPLGFRVGAAAWDGRAGVGGILDLNIPVPEPGQDLALTHPVPLGETGLEAFLNGLYRLGAQKGDLRVKLSGSGASEEGQEMGVGERNLMIAQRLFWMQGLIVASRDLRCGPGRTLGLELATGKVTVQDQERTFEI